ncbi:hypothetical protein [Thalassospira tepidiphila]|uniref:hypothetical protein n=1 Tax=Thalassospira tepidiphila TaxID=393657 RepID=UPI0029222FB6|nr:hypothetical protein MACH01_10660 [Thalassospira tepidiphila]
MKSDIKKENSESESSFFDVLYKLSTSVSAVVIAGIAVYAYFYYSKISLVSEEIEAIKSLSVDVDMGIEKEFDGNFSTSVDIFEDGLGFITPVVNNQFFPISVIPNYFFVMLSYNSDGEVKNFFIDASTVSNKPSYIQPESFGSVYLKLSRAEKFEGKVIDNNENDWDNILKIIREKNPDACMVSSYLIYPRFNKAYKKVVNKMRVVEYEDFVSVYPIVESINVSNKDNDSIENHEDDDCFNRYDFIVESIALYLKGKNEKVSRIKGFISSMYPELEADEVSLLYKRFLGS